jgi:hypothetical protein
MPKSPGIWGMSAQMGSLAVRLRSEAGAIGFVAAKPSGTEDQVQQIGNPGNVGLIRLVFRVETDRGPRIVLPQGRNAE